VAKTGGGTEEWISETSDLLNELAYHEFHRKVLPLEQGDLSPIFRLDDELYVVFVREREEARGQSFAEVKEL
jgi:hypothetical protein